MVPAKTFHGFSNLPPEIQLAIWKIPLKAGYILEHQDPDFWGDITLRPLTWDYSSLRESCVDAARVVQESCELVTLPDPLYCITPRGEKRTKLWLDSSRTTIHFLTPPRFTMDDFYPLSEFLEEKAIKYASFTWERMSQAGTFCALYDWALFEHLNLTVFIYAESTGKPGRGDDIPPPSEMAEGIESRERTEDDDKGLVDILSVSKRKYVALTEDEFDVVRESMYWHSELRESSQVYQEGFPDEVYPFRFTFGMISALGNLSLRGGTTDA